MVRCAAPAFGRERGGGAVAGASMEWGWVVGERKRGWKEDGGGIEGKAQVGGFR